MSEIHKIIKIRKRDGRIVEFAQEKITNAIFKAAKAVGGSDRKTAEELSNKVLTIIEYKFGPKETPTVEEVQDIVEKVLIKNGHAKTAKTYILYRQQRAKLRETKDMFIDIKDTITSYLGQTDWRVRENSNEGVMSFSGLNARISGEVLANFALNQIYSEEIKRARKTDQIRGKLEGVRSPESKRVNPVFHPWQSLPGGQKTPVLSRLCPPASCG